MRSFLSRRRYSTKPHHDRRLQRLQSRALRRRNASPPDIPLTSLIGGVLTVLTLEAGISTTCWYGWLGVISVLTALCALCFVGLVLWPRSNPWRALAMGVYTPVQVLYPPGRLGPQDTVASWAAAALSTEWVSELTYELLKLASIRAAKQLWYRWALATSGASIVAAAVRLFLPHS
jgi:hypothetical protein